MRKFVVIFLLPAFLGLSDAVSTEKEVPYTVHDVYLLSQADYGMFYKDIPDSPRVYGETPVYSNDNLARESGKITPQTTVQIVDLRINKQGIPVFQLSNHQFIAADKRLLYNQNQLQNQKKNIWLEPGFKVYNSPYDLQEVPSDLQDYQSVSASLTVFINGQEFFYVDNLGWLAKESISEEDNRMKQVQALLSENYQQEGFSIYVKQLDTGKEAGIHQDQKMYAASILKLPYLYDAQEKINQGVYTLETSFSYSSAVNDFPGSYRPEGSGSLPKVADNKEYQLQELIQKVAKESDNVAHNILGYYVTNQSDAQFKENLKKIMREDWDPKEKLLSSKMAGKMIEAIYYQDGFVLQALSQTNFDHQRIAKGIPVKIAHKIGDADEYKHDTAIVYADSPFVLSIFTKDSDYDTIAKIAEEVYQVLK